MNSYTVLDGRLVAEPKKIDLKSGKTLTKVRLADNPPGKRDDKRPARFVTGKAFGKQGEALLRLAKGDVITATGSLGIEEFDQKDGTKGRDDVLMISQFRVQKSETFFNNNGPKAEAAPEAESLDDLFGGSL